MTAKYGLVSRLGCRKKEYNTHGGGEGGNDQEEGEEKTKRKRKKKGFTFMHSSCMFLT